jgi:hypothetical protein
MLGVSWGDESQQNCIECSVWTCHYVRRSGVRHLLGPIKSEHFFVNFNQTLLLINWKIILKMIGESNLRSNAQELQWHKMKIELISMTGCQKVTIIFYYVLFNTNNYPWHQDSLNDMFVNFLDEESDFSHSKWIQLQTEH